MARTFAGLLAVAWLALLGSACCADDGGVSAAMRQRLGLPADLPVHWVHVASSPDRGYSEEQASANAPDIVSFEAAHIGVNRLLFQLTFAAAPQFATGHLIIYADMDNNPATGRADKDHAGVDLMVGLGGDSMSITPCGPPYSAQNTSVGVGLEGNSVFVVLDAPLPETGDTIPIGLHLLSQRSGGQGDSTLHAVVQLPRSGGSLPPIPVMARSGLKPLSTYRYVDNLVKFEALPEKGLRYEDVAPATPITFGRPCPDALFATGDRKQAAGTLGIGRVKVSLLEEAGVSRTATPVSFGLPLPQGAVFKLEHMRLLSPAGKPVPAQFTATSFWPDDSLKWVLVGFAPSLKAGASADYVAEFGNAVSRSRAASPLRLTENADAITVVTGPLKAVVDKRRFNILRGVWVDVNRDGAFTDGERVAASADDGVRMVDEQGKLFSTANRPPESVKIEEQGPEKIVIRVRGKYAAADGTDYQSYETRLTFHAGSPVVTVAHSHIDTYLKTEFTDIRSLVMPLELAGGVQMASVYLGDSFTPHTAASLNLFQGDEKSCSLKTPQDAITGGRAPGVISCTGGAGKISAVVHDFWQRWPKGLSADQTSLNIELLPPQRGPEYGKNLPFYLMYPFVEGCYRFKWGMAFTERVSFDFGGKLSPQQLAADANRPLIAALPATWYQQTRALGPLAVPRGQQFAAWDEFIRTAYGAFMASREKEREYGYFNYGDWFGERGRNWGNNEYDMAHAYFMQFARTGNRDYFRFAQQSARHQADVDCIHAYPDPAYIGGDNLHSVAHTGTWSQNDPLGSWSFPYSYHATAASGHVWTDGMAEDWYLSGDARVMESALAFGEHVVWSMAPGFEELGTHERSAGWSLKAILALYRSTNDPLYLQAARKIASVALREQKFDQGGAWPHVLPIDHAGDQPGAVGNNMFLIGILLNGLADYHDATRDPAALKSLESGVNWVLKCWDPKALGWPYSARWDGVPLYSPNAASNPLIVKAIAYMGAQDNDPRKIQVAEDGLWAYMASVSPSDGKSIAQGMVLTSDTLGILQDYYGRHRADKGLTVLGGGDEQFKHYMARVSDASVHSVRAPNVKTFWVRLTAGDTAVVATRKPYGAMNKAAEFGTLEVTDAAGNMIAQDRYSTDTAYETRVALTGAPGAAFKVTVDDDQRAVWSLAGDGTQIVMQTTPGFSIGGVGHSRYHFFVPAGTREFRIRIMGQHTGAYGGVVFSPQNKLISFYRGVNPGPALIRGAQAQTTEHPERGALTVTPNPDDTGKVWSVVLWAAGDIACELDGVPPYMSLSADGWFDPHK